MLRTRWCLKGKIMFDALMYLKVFLVGGFVCLIGQVLIITTQMTSARILVTFLMIGVVMEVFKVFEPVKEFCGSGITVPIIGFGYSLARGAIQAFETDGVLGILTGGLQAVAGGIAAAVVSAFIVSLVSKSRTKQ